MIVPLLHSTSMSRVRTRFVHSDSGVKTVVIYGKDLFNSALRSKTEPFTRETAGVACPVAIAGSKVSGVRCRRDLVSLGDGSL